MSDTLAMGETPIWSNNCRRCNTGDGQHSPQACCIICRNYTTIDRQAASFSIDTVLSAGKGGQTVRSALEGQKNKMDALQTKLEDTIAARDQAYNVHKVKQPAAEKVFSEWQPAADKVNACFEQYERLFEVYKANPTEQTKKNKDLKYAAYEALVAKRDEVGKRLDPLNAELEAIGQRIDDATNQKKALELEISQEVAASELLVQRIARKLISLANIDQNDHVSRARFFYTWIGQSLRYDKKAMVLNVRKPIVSLLNGYEVCAGYAELFKTMFDTDFAAAPIGSAASPKRECVYILGWAKQGSAETAPSDDRLHAWNAFPYVEGGVEKWQVIDCCWGAGNVNDQAGSAAVDPIWFNKPNVEFLNDHIPEKEAQQYQINKTVTPSATLWSQATPPNFYAPAKFINKAKVLPAENLIPWKKQAFQYRLSCLHLRPLAMPNFALRIVKAGDNSPVNLDTLVWLFRQERGVEGSVWTTEVDLALGAHANCDQVQLVGFFLESASPPPPSGASGGPSQLPPVPPGLAELIPAPIANLKELKDWKKPLVYKIAATWSRAK